MRVFTEEALRLYDGSHGLAYVACNGSVYDVSGSYHWRGGVHHVMHRAGCDLTHVLERAPHGMDLFHKFPIVGELDGHGDSRPSAGTEAPRQVPKARIALAARRPGRQTPRAGSR